MKPLLSIVIANYNYGRFLEEAIKSVLAQKLVHRLELIICDGGSTDNSVEIIKKFAGGLPPNTSRAEWTQSSAGSKSQQQDDGSQCITWWCSEKDRGQSEAFNKGFSHANGEFLAWLNADDVLLPNVVECLDKAIQKHPQCEWFVGGVMWLDKDMRIMKMGRARPFSEIRFSYGELQVWGPSSFFTKRLLEGVHGVDERFHYTMDVDLWIQFASRMNARFIPFCRYAWGFRFHEAAKTSAINFKESGRSDRQHPMWEQLRKESEWRREKFRPSKKKTFLNRLLSVNFREVLGAMWDTMRYRHRHYTSYFEGAK